MATRTLGRRAQVSVLEKENPAATETISVKFGKLTERLQIINIQKGTSIYNFMSKRSMPFGPSVRVNGDEVESEYILQQGDIITDIDNVEGGY